MVSAKLFDRYFVFEKKEQKDFLITSVIFSLILFFFAWRTTDFTILGGIIAFIQFIIIVLGSLFLFISVSIPMV